MTIPVGLVVPGFTGTYTTIKDVWGQRKAGAKAMLRMAVLRTMGVDLNATNFAGFVNFNTLKEAHFTMGWGAGQAVHWGVGKKMKVNQALGRAHVPFFRV